MRVDRYEQWPINVRTIVIETDAYVENCGKNSTADLAFLTLFLSISCIPKKKMNIIWMAVKKRTNER